MAEQMFIKGAESATRFEVKRYGYTLTFEISPDALECNCCYEPSNIGGTPITELELQEHLAKFDLKAWIDQEAVAALLVSAASAESVSDLLLAKGIPMTRGEDGKVVLAVADDLAKKPDEVGDGTVNFHNVQSFLNV
jgi:uncharacterized protein (DUF342 family)